MGGPIGIRHLWFCGRRRNDNEGEEEEEKEGGDGGEEGGEGSEEEEGNKKQKTMGNGMLPTDSDNGTYRVLCGARFVSCGRCLV